MYCRCGAVSLSAAGFAPVAEDAEDENRLAEVEPGMGAGPKCDSGPNRLGLDGIHVPKSP